MLWTSLSSYVFSWYQTIRIFAGCYLRALGLTKSDLLAYLVRAGEADAQDVAKAFGVRYSVAAMALLRLVRQGLAGRYRTGTRGAYRYKLSERGQSRLAYLRTSHESSG